VQKLADKSLEVYGANHALARPVSRGITVRALDCAAGKPPLRVLHLIDRLGMGGTECVMLKVIEGLEDGAFEHRVCTVRGVDSTLARAHRLEDKVYVAGRPKTGYQFLIGHFARIMRSYRPHIVHSRNWGTIEAIPAARLARVPLVIHSEHGYELDMLVGLPSRRRLFRRAAYAMADAVFTVTEELRSYHARQAWISAERIRVLPNGVDTVRFAPRPEKHNDIRQRLGIPKESFAVGTVGRMVKIKDQQTLLKAAEILVSRGVPVHVLLGGSGPEHSSLSKVAASSPALAGRVAFLGSVANVPELLNAMDVFVLPSISEGMSNTILEAMASGLPVVATRVGGNPELVEENRSGWLFEPGDETDLAARLERLAANPDLSRDLGTAARQRAVSNFSLDGMIGRYRDLYFEMASRRGIPADSQI
jgi:sugar transferase (PEP-CTERM/EpsH1 system associated)